MCWPCLTWLWNKSAGVEAESYCEHVSHNLCLNYLKELGSEHELYTCNGLEHRGRVCFRMDAKQSYESKKLEKAVKHDNRGHERNLVK